MVVTGTGVISPLGDSREALHRSLIRASPGFVRGPELGSEALPEPWVAAILDFDPELYLGEVNLRPLDRTGRLAGSAARLALEDAGLVEGLAELDVGLVVGTFYGSVRTIAEFDRRGLESGPLYVKPFDFANSVINAAAGQVAILYRLRGPNVTVSTGAASGVHALALGTDLVAGRHADVVLAGGAEELSFESVLAFSRAGLLSDGAVPQPLPFDARRSGFFLGEGAAFVVLETPESAASRGARPLLEVLGHGAAFDASLGEDEERGVSAVAQAVGRALDGAGLAATDVDSVSVAASGSRAVDRREALGLGRALADRAAEVAVTAPKGLFGEALGASGALQAVALVAAIEAGELSGVPGLGEREADFPLAAASPEPTRADHSVALLDGVSLDGHCCSVVFGRV